MFEIYGTQQCPWCDRAKELVSSNGFEYIYTDVGESEEAQQMFRQNSYRTVPQVYHNGVHIGGYEATQQFLKENN
jgi:glutaredoxin